MLPHWPAPPHARLDSLIRRQNQLDTDIKRLFRRLPSLEHSLPQPIPFPTTPPPFECTHVKTVFFDGSNNGGFGAIPPQGGLDDGRGLNVYNSFFDLSPDLTLAQFELSLTGGTSGWTIFNGTHILTYDPAATNTSLRIITWTTILALGTSIRLEIREGSDLRIVLSDNNSPLKGQVWRKTECTGTFTNFFTVNPGGVVPTLTGVIRV